MSRTWQETAGLGRPSAPSSRQEPGDDGPWAPMAKARSEAGGRQAKRGSEAGPCHPNRALSRLTSSLGNPSPVSRCEPTLAPGRGLSILQPPTRPFGKSIQPSPKLGQVTCSGHRTRVASSPLKLNETQFLPLSCHKNCSIVVPTKGMLLESTNEDLRESGTSK